MATKPVIDTLHKNTEKDSLLSMLNNPPQENLLKEAMERPGALNFGKATNEAYAEFDKLKEQNTATQHKADEAEREEVLPDAEEQTVQEEEQPDKIASEEDSRWYALNEEQQRYRDRQEMLERELLQARQQQSQTLEELKRTIPQPQEQLYPYDLTDPNDLRKYRDDIRNDVLREVRSSQQPLLQRMAHKEFFSTVARLQGSLEHFNQYLPKQKLEQWYATALGSMPVEQVLNVDWEKELTLAYQAADYQRVTKELSEIKRGKETEKKSANSEREEQKSNLKLVPKANAKGTTAKKGVNDKLAEWRSASSGRFGMDDVSANLKRELGLG